MKLTKIIAAVAATFTALTPLASSAQAQQFLFPGLELQGDQKDACGALMCLAAGQTPSECNPYLQRYFSIVMQKPWQTVSARLQFLQKCPVSTRAAR